MSVYSIGTCTKIFPIRTAVQMKFSLKGVHFKNYHSNVGNQYYDPDLTSLYVLCRSIDTNMSILPLKVLPEPIHSYSDYARVIEYNLTCAIVGYPKHGLE